MNAAGPACSTGAWPMHRIGSDALRAYMLSDPFDAWLGANSAPNDGTLTCQRWLASTPAKRYAAHLLYGDLLAGSGLDILDVGGGLTTITRALASAHRLTLIDMMAHDRTEDIEAFRASCAPFTAEACDWYQSAARGPFDVVVAADLFPNVDQRLELFLERMLPVSGEVRLSLTYYNHPRFYLTRRLDGDEILCMLAWNGAQTAAALARFRDRCIRPAFDIFDAKDDSVFANQRQVCMVRLRGDHVRAP